MSYAQIDIGFTKYSTPGGTEYMLRTEINSLTSTPDAVDTCLVIQKGDDTSNEELVSVATRDQLVVTPLTALPATIATFSSPSLLQAQTGDPLAPTSIQTGDVIRVTSPDIWKQFFTVGTTVDYTVDTIVDTTTVTVTPEFPAFARNLTFEVIRSGTTILPTPPPSGSSTVYPTDGLANRDYSATPTETQYLASEHVDSWTDLTVAENRLISLKVQAESLITEMNTAEWTGTESAVYP